MTYQQQAYRIAHDPKHGGCEGIAPRLGLSPAVLRNKVNIHNDNNHLRLDEAFALMSVTGDEGIIKAMATQLGGVICQIADLGEREQTATIETLTDVFMCTIAKQGAACADTFMLAKQMVICAKTTARLSLKKLMMPSLNYKNSFNC